MRASLTGDGAAFGQAPPPRDAVYRVPVSGPLEGGDRQVVRERRAAGVRAQGLVQLRDVVVDGRAGLEDLQNAVHAELVTAGVHLLDEAVAEDDQA